MRSAASSGTWDDKRSHNVTYRRHNVYSTKLHLVFPEGSEEAFSFLLKGPTYVVMQNQACFTWTPRDSVIKYVGPIVFGKMRNDERMFKGLSMAPGHMRNMNISPAVALL